MTAMVCGDGELRSVPVQRLPRPRCSTVTTMHVPWLVCLTYKGVEVGLDDVPELAGGPVTCPDNNLHLVGVASLGEGSESGRGCSAFHAQNHAHESLVRATHSPLAYQATVVANVKDIGFNDSLITFYNAAPCECECVGSECEAFVLCGGWFSTRS